MTSSWFFIPQHVGLFRSGPVFGYRYLCCCMGSHPSWIPEIQVALQMCQQYFVCNFLHCTIQMFSSTLRLRTVPNIYFCLAQKWLKPALGEVTHFLSVRSMPIVNSHHEMPFNNDWLTSKREKWSSEFVSRKGHSKRGLEMKDVYCFDHLTRQFGRNFLATQRLSHWYLDRRP